MKHIKGIVYAYGVLAVAAGVIVYAGWFLSFALPSPLRAALGMLLVTFGLNWLFGGSFHPASSDETADAGGLEREEPSVEAETTDREPVQPPALPLFHS